MNLILQCLQNHKVFLIVIITLLNTFPNSYGMFFPNHGNENEIVIILIESTFTEGARIEKFCLIPNPEAANEEDASLYILPSGKLPALERCKSSEGFAEINEEEENRRIHNCMSQILLEQTGINLEDWKKNIKSIRSDYPILQKHNGGCIYRFKINLIIDSRDIRAFEQGGKPKKFIDYNSIKDFQQKQESSFLKGTIAYANAQIIKTFLQD